MRPYHYALPLTPAVVGVGEDASRRSSCIKRKTCVIMRADDDSRLANEFVRSFVRRYQPPHLLPKQMELSLSA